jgi:CBS-domain-containing membrane protein
MTDRHDHPQKLEHITRDLWRLIVCAAGAAAGIGLAIWSVDMPSSPLLLASLGGSAVFLFGLTLALVAVVWSRLVPGMAHYPVKWLDKSPPFMFWGGWSE